MRSTALVTVVALLLASLGGCSGRSPPAPPALTSIDPSLGDTAGGVRLRLEGAHLDEVSAVDVGGARCQALEIESATSLRCTAPALTAGSHDVMAIAAAGSAVLAGAYQAWSPASLPGAQLFQSDRGAVLVDEADELPVWSMVAGSAPFLPRDGAGLVSALGRLWLLGGWDSAGPAAWAGLPTTNEVWVSDDGGATWEELLPHASSPPTSGAAARFGPRHTAGWLRLDVDGVEHLYVVGGDIYNGGAPDVWRSADGVRWELVTDAAPWGARVLHMVGVYQGALYLMGGQIDVADPTTCLADVWRSTDGGLTWQRLDDAPWAPRGMVYGLVEHDGFLWLIGGGTYDDGPRSYFNDVWRFDGASWQEVLPDGAAPWAPRQYHNVYSWHDALWISSGYQADDQNHGDVWHSVDGVEWIELPAQAFAPGHADGVAVTPAGPVHASGNAFDTEVFQLATVRGARLSSWEAQGTGAALQAVATTSAPLWLAARVAGQPAVRLGGGAVLRREWQPLPNGWSIFWIGSTLRDVSAGDSPNAGQVIVGDSRDSCRAQIGYGGQRAELALTDALGSWADGHMLRGELPLADGSPHLVGFTLEVDGHARAFVDGDAVGEPFDGPYDAPFMGWDSVGAGFGVANADVDLGAVLIAPAALDDADLARLSTWSRKWGAGR